jgi:hypothetical protein
MKQKPSSRRRRSNTKSVLRLPELEHAKAAVLNSLHSADAKRVIVTPSMSLLTGIARNRAWPSTGSWFCVIVLISNPVNSPPAPSICVLAHREGIREEHRCGQVGAARSAADLCPALPCFGRRVGTDPILFGTRLSSNHRTLPWPQAADSICRQ